MLFPVFPGGHAGVFLEDPGEVAVGGKAQVGADGRQGLVGIAEEALGFLRLADSQVGELQLLSPVEEMVQGAQHLQQGLHRQTHDGVHALQEGGDLLPGDIQPESQLPQLLGVGHDLGSGAHEYTDATTGGMVSAGTGEFDPAIIEALDLPKHLFRPLQRPGEVIGEYDGIRVVLCAAHDTASAVEGIPMDADAPYISSGTWSLLGVKTVKPITDAASEKGNWSNEGGVGYNRYQKNIMGYNRYQKNIMGMWLVNRLRAELCPDKAWDEITAEAAASSFGESVDANAQVFLAPESMRAAFDGLLSQRPREAGDYFRCAYRSLALSYAGALRELERNTGRQYDRIYIVGGGAKNAILNGLTEKATGKKVIALPIEATAVGNLKIQICRGG